MKKTHLLSAICLYVIISAPVNSYAIDYVSSWQWFGNGGDIGVALGDVDGDGDIDAVMADGWSGNDVWLNNGDGIFTNTGRPFGGNSSTVAVELGDLDGDGDLDAAIANSTTANVVWFNDGKGDFTSGGVIGVGDGYDISLGDVDGDGDLDVVSANVHEDSLFINNGSGVFTNSGQTFQGFLAGSTSVAMGDIDGDQDLDIVFGKDSGDAHKQIWLNDGSGLYTAAEQAFVSGQLILGDIDKDGDLDALVINNGTQLWLNDGSGNFTMAAQVTGTLFSAYTVVDVLSDIDNDGDLDAIANTNQVWLNNGSGVFSKVFNELEINNKVTEIKMGDLDGDGDSDAFMSTPAFEANHVWFNDGVGVLTPSGQWLGDRSSMFAELGDIDGDGDLDAIVANGFQSSRKWINNGNATFTDHGSVDAGQRKFKYMDRLGDIDNDGDMDIVSTNKRALFNDGNGNFTYTGSVLPIEGTAIELGDVDADGDLDAVIAAIGPNAVILNDGDGYFSDSGQVLQEPANAYSSSYAVALGDIDGDGDLDAILPGGKNQVWFNNGSGVFNNGGMNHYIGSMNDIALGDVDSDGDLDMLLANYNNNVWLNNGKGVFADSGQSLAEHSAKSVELGDVDNDGDLDAIMTYFEAANPAIINDGANQVWLNDGSGVFSDSGIRLANSSTSSASLGDLDNNGSLDIFSANTNANRVWLNVSPGNAGLHDIAGTVKTAGDQDICAMVLASGRFMFSCKPKGVFSLAGLPREKDGTVKRQIYADGFFPKIDTLPGSSNDAVVMTRSGTCPGYNVPSDPGFFPDSSGRRINISGKVLRQNSTTPICAMVLANGKHMFSCDAAGSYVLNIPLDKNGQFKLQVYADGFAPTIQIFDESRLVNDVRMVRTAECQ